MGPYGPGGPYGIGGPYGSGGLYGSGAPQPVQKPNATGAPWGPYGPWGPWGPYGGPYGPGGPYGVGGPYGPGGPYGVARSKRGLFGLAMFGPYAGLHQQMIASKFNWISSSIILKKQFSAITLGLNDDLEVAQGDLESKLDALNLNADQAVLEAEAAGRDISACVSALQAASDDVSEKIKALDIDASESELGKNITRNIGLLNAQIGKYGKVFKLCKAQFGSLLTQMDDIQDCTTNQKSVIDEEVEDQKKGINDDISQLQSNIADLIKEVTADVEEQIQKASNDFKACSS